MINTLQTGVALPVYVQFIMGLHGVSQIEKAFSAWRMSILVAGVK